MKLTDYPEIGHHQMILEGLLEKQKTLQTETRYDMSIFQRNENAIKMISGTKRSPRMQILHHESFHARKLP